jgi:hypothetical protein
MWVNWKKIGAGRVPDLDGTYRGPQPGEAGFDTGSSGSGSDPACFVLVVDVEEDHAVVT